MSASVRERSGGGVVEGRTRSARRPTDDVNARACAGGEIRRGKDQISIADRPTRRCRRDRPTDTRSRRQRIVDRNACRRSRAGRAAVRDRDRKPDL